MSQKWACRVLQDLEYYNSLNWIINNSVESLEMVFSVDEEKLGETIEVELKPNGANIPVTDRNKLEYVKWVTTGTSQLITCPDIPRVALH